jgi:WD40 repeat protein
MDFKGLVIKEFSVINQSFTLKRLKRFKKLCRESKSYFFKENKSGCLKILEKDSTILTATDGKKLCLWDSNTGKMLEILKFNFPISYMNSTSTSIIISLKNHQIFTLDLITRSLKLLTKISKDWTSFSSFSISFDSRWLITKSSENELLILDLQFPSEDKNLDNFKYNFGENLWISSFRPFHFSNNLAIALEKKVLIWSIEQKFIIQEIQGLESEVERLLILANDDFLVFSSRDLTLTLWDLKNERKIWKRSLGRTSTLSLVSDHEGKFFFTGEFDVRVWQVDQEVKRLGNTSVQVTSLCVTQDDLRLVVGYINLQVILWDLRKEIAIKSFEFLNGKLKKIALFGNGRNLAGLTQKSYFYIWNEKSEVKFIDNQRLVYDFSVSNDGRSVFLIVFNKALIQLDMETFSTRKISFEIKNKIRILSPSPSLMIFADLNKIFINNREKGEQSSILSTYTKISAIRTLCMSRSLKYLIVSSLNLKYQVFKLIV